jgi:hypothetical protein
MMPLQQAKKRLEKNIVAIDTKIEHILQNVKLRLKNCVFEGYFLLQPPVTSVDVDHDTAY